MEQIQPELSLPKPAQPKFQKQQPPPTKLPASKRIAIKQIRITGATRFPTHRLHALVASAEGQTLSLAQLNKLAQRITDYYRAHGYLLSRAYIPAQTIQHGVVKIAVLEGQLSSVQVDNAAGLGGAALAPLKAIPTGQPLTISKLERGLLLASDNPGVNIHAGLRPGEHVGHTILHARVTPRPRLTGAIGEDNYGNKYTGVWRTQAQLNVNEPLHLGDQLSFTGLFSTGNLRYFQAAYQLPINHWGTRAGLAYGHLHYELGDEFEDLDASGYASVASAWLQHPIIRSRAFNLYIRAQYDRKDLKDTIGLFDTSDYSHLNNATFSLSGDLTDGWLGGGVNAFNVSYTVGHLNLAPHQNRLQNAASVDTQGWFGHLNLGYQRLQRINRIVSVYFRYTAQFSQDNLAPVEQMSLGGAHRVRAYPLGEAAADQAQLATLEGRFNLPSFLPGTWQFVAFGDYGYARLHADPWTPDADNHRDLSDAGIGLNIAPGYGIHINTSLAWRLGDEHAQAGSGTNPRAWVHLVKQFR